MKKSLIRNREISSLLCSREALIWWPTMNLSLIGRFNFECKQTSYHTVTKIPDIKILKKNKFQLYKKQSLIRLFELFDKYEHWQDILAKSSRFRVHSKNNSNTKYKTIAQTIQLNLMFRFIPVFFYLLIRLVNKYNFVFIPIRFFKSSSKQIVTVCIQTENMQL